MYNKQTNTEYMWFINNRDNKSSHKLSHCINCGSKPYFVLVCVTSLSRMSKHNAWCRVMFVQHDVLTCIYTIRITNTSLRTSDEISC